MPSLYAALLLAVVAAALCWSLIGLYVLAFPSRHLAEPNERSMHRVPVPVGAGLAIVATALVLWPLSQGAMVRDHGALIASIAALGALSWLDDRRPLSPAIRLGAQALCVALCLASLGPERVAPAIPLALERIVLALSWLWFINLFNFMDGIDGLAGSEAIAIALGYVLLLTCLGTDGPLWHRR